MRKIKPFIQDLIILSAGAMLLISIFLMFKKLSAMRVSQQQIVNGFKPQPSHTPARKKVKLNRLGLDYQKKGVTLEEILK